MRYVLIYCGTALLSLALFLVEPGYDEVRYLTDDCAAALWPFGVVMLGHGIIIALNAADKKKK